VTYTGDLNIHRNPHALPRAWFVGATEVTPAERHLDRLADTAFDLEARGLLAGPLPVAASPTARVTGIDSAAPDRRAIAVEAPQGGVLLVSERFAAGWQARDQAGTVLPVVRADSVLLAVGVPAGTTRIDLTYASPTLLPSMAVSLLALAGIGLAALAGARPVQPPGAGESPERHTA
jgi:hypothetical protein